MSVRTRDGRYEIKTGMSMFTERRMQPMNAHQERREREEGPMFQIIYSLDTWDAAVRRQAELVAQFGGRVRVDLIPSREESERLATGLFEVVEVGEVVKGEGDVEGVKGE